MKKTSLIGPAVDCGAGQHRVSENRLMNRCLCVWVGSLLSALALVSRASGQTPPPPVPAPAAAGAPSTSIPLGSQTAAVLTQPMKDQIAKFVQEQFTAISGTDFTAQSNARKTLIGAMAAGSQPAYYSWLTQQWLTASTGAIAKNVPLGVRLNIAIVTETLASSSQSMEIEPLVRLLVSDREPAVALRGIKAARPLMIIIMQTQNVAQSPLAAALVAAVKKHGNVELIGGFIAQDAYRDFLITAVQGVTDSVIRPKIPPLVPPVLDILEYRISLHVAGAVQSPGVEREIATFLSGQYLSVIPATQKRMVQDLINLETYVGQRAALYQNSKSDLTQIREMIKYITSALNVIDPAAQSTLGWLSSPPPSSTPADMLAHTKQVYAAVSANPNFSWVVAPPAIPVIEPPPLIVPTAPAAPGGAPAPAAPPAR